MDSQPRREGGTGMIKDDDFDSISIEVTAERLLVDRCRNAGGDPPAHIERYG
jgi:hypothetical protein